PLSVVTEASAGSPSVVAGESGNSPLSRNSTIRPSAFRLKRCISDSPYRVSAERVKLRLTISRCRESGARLRESAGISFKRGLLQPKPQRRDAEKREEADHVGDGGHESARCHRRVRAHPLQHHGNQDATQRAGYEIADNGEPDHDAEPGNLEPGHRGNAGDDS